MLRLLQLWGDEWVFVIPGMSSDIEVAVGLTPQFQ